MGSDQNHKNNLSIYLLAISTSVSLGNFWRFPYIVGENGGGLFLFLYLFFCFILGFPLLVGELIIGEKIKSHLLGFYQSKRNLLLVVLLGLFVLSYYSVISGWVLYFLTQFAVSISTHSGYRGLGIQALLKNGILQWMLSSVHIILVIFLLTKNAFSLVSKWIKIFIPLFFLVFFLLLMQTLSLPSREEAIRFLFYPDFEKFKLSSIGAAIGHVFFTFSIGFGTLLVVGAFLKGESRIPVVGFRIALFDSLVSIMSLLIIFPIAFLVTNTSLKDPALFFDVIPQFFSQMRGGYWIGFIFFVFFYASALNMTLSVFQSLVNHLKVIFNFKSEKGMIFILGLGLLVLSGIPAMLSNYLNNAGFLKRSLIELFDLSLIQLLLPVVVLLLIRKILVFTKKTDFKAAFDNSLLNNAPVSYEQWLFLIKFICPALIVIGLVLQVIELFL